ncbi:hypothetical protein Vadar_001871 [Vaccinium darrowii]|uniref:Uncharacterized protein n=1 Tax=Vaccinium darrowii TaxID=229202 RepID=A0ACB7ZGQ0_9ERIC|nr:hypothetical protein Vadar_001871 [Vaccinium darrowii]
MPPAIFDLIIHHKGKVGRIHNVDPEMYSYFDMLADVNESVMSAYPSGLGLAFSVFCELAGSGYRVHLDSDKAILDLFSIDGLSSTLNLFVEVETPNSSQVVNPNQLEVNGDQDDVGDKNEGDDHVYGFSDEDNDWIGDMEGEVELDDAGSLTVEIIGEDEGLSDYQSRDDEGCNSSGSDDAIESRIGFDTSYGGKEPFLDSEGEVVLEENMIYADVHAFRAKLRDYTVEKGIHASPLPDGVTYKIKKMNADHTCSRVNQNEDATSTWISKKLLNDFKENPNLDLDGMQEKLNNRPFIGVDGCHLKGPYGGVLISAVALDGNNGLFPLAVAVVESENNDSWGFFLDHIQTIIRSTRENRPWTIMSDQQKGLDGVVARILPEASHRHCARHLFQNFKAKFPGLALKKQFWIAARAYNHRKFNEAMATIKELNTEAHDHLLKLAVSSWARHAFDERVRSDHITNNGAESFNNWLGNLRGKPILTMLEGISDKNTEGCKALQGFCGGTEYDVMDNGVRHLVDLGRIMCVCRQWEISGIPCKHAMAAIVKDRKNVEDFIHTYYSKEMYLRAHGRMIHPILDHTMWITVPGDPLDPPPLKRLPGRPRKVRRRAANEPAAGTSESKRSQTVKCTWCKEFGHNKRTCQRGPVRGKGGPRGNTQNNGRVGTSGNEMGGTVTAVSTTSTSRGRGIYRGRGGGAIRGRGSTRGGGTRGRGSTRGRSTTRRGNSRGRGPNATSKNQNCAIKDGLYVELYILGSDKLYECVTSGYARSGMSMGLHWCIDI